MKRIRLVFVLLAVGLLVPTGLLVRRALESVAVEKAARHRVVAERLFDEMERSLSGFLEREEARPVGHYRFYYSPEGSPGSGVRSPLSEPPAQPFVVGYFQIDPDGSVHTPLRPRPEERSRAVGKDAPVAENERRAGEVQGILAAFFEAGGEARDAAAKASADEAQAPGSTVALDELQADLNAAPRFRDDRDARETRDEMDAPEEAVPEDAYGALQSLNRGVQQRAGRGRKIVAESALEELKALGYVGDYAEGSSAAREYAKQDKEEGERAMRQQPQAAAERVAGLQASPGLAAPTGERREPERRLRQNAARADAASPQASAPDRMARRPSRDPHALSAPSAPSASPAPSAKSVSPAPVARAAPAGSRGAGLADSPAASRRPAAPPRAPQSIRVAVDPLIGRVVDAEHLLLTRAVFVGDQGFRQGLVVDLSELTAWLRRETVGASGLRSASVAFLTRFSSADAPGEEPYLYRHRLAEPFQGVSARLSLTPLGDLGGERTIYTFSALLLLTGAGGLLALYRMVGVTVSFAERRSNFVAAVSHELKTPLTAIRMYGEMLRDGIVPSDAKRQEYYETITAESERLSRLINNVLEFSRLEKGNREMNLVAGEIGPVVEELVELARPHAEREGFALRVEVAPGLPAVRFDRDALLQVLFNLVDNALKYAREASDREVWIECRPRGAGVVLAVRDHGPGVPARHLARLFEPFYRGQDELTRTTQGTGLGLALVKGLVERMGAAISGSNAEGGGFEVCIAFGGTASRV